MAKSFNNILSIFAILICLGLALFCLIILIIYIKIIKFFPFRNVLFNKLCILFVNDKLIILFLNSYVGLFRDQ
jgi:hypothetical protein